MKPSKSSVKGAAMGAALAAVVTVTVYEGGVVVAGNHGDQQVAAGERVVVEEGSAAAKVEPAPEVAAANAPPPADATREQLLARDATQRETIATLSARVAQLEHQAGNPVDGIVIKERSRAGGEYRLDEDGDGRPWFDPSPELLKEFAEECRIRFDTPPLDDSDPFQLSEAQAAEVGITPEERSAINEGMRRMHERWQSRLIALYLEATGEVDRDRAAQMSPSALAREIEDKAADGEAEALRAQIARERAGLAKAPTDLSGASPLERYMRGLVGLGDEMERMLADVLGKERARALREIDDGWGAKHEMAGCARR